MHFDGSFSDLGVNFDHAKGRGFARPPKKKSLISRSVCEDQKYATVHVLIQV